MNLVRSSYKTIRAILGKATEGFEEEDEVELTANPWGIVKRADLPLPRFYFFSCRKQVF
jgi:hypothetical protein